VARFVGVTGTGTVDGEAIALEEHEDGDVALTLTKATTNTNADDGIQAEQEAPGVGTLRLVATNVAGNADDQVNLDGVTQI
jgi:hypothetical protein